MLHALNFYLLLAGQRVEKLPVATVSQSVIDGDHSALDFQVRSLTLHTMSDEEGQWQQQPRRNLKPKRKKS